MLYGYIDESGTPGPANKNEDYFSVCLVLVEKSKKSSIEKSLLELHGTIKASEIHFAHNSNHTRTKILQEIPNLDFRYIIISIKKNGSRNYASCATIAKLLAEESKKCSDDIHIEMDINPTLHKELSSSFKRSGIHASIREVRSQSSPCIQLADYLVSISVKAIKGQSSSIPSYKKIAKKCIAHIKKA